MTDEEKAFRAALVALLPRLRRFGVALTGNRSEAEDVVQSAVERALRSWAQFDHTRRLDSWMYKILENVWRDTKRAAVRLPLYTDQPLDAEGEDGRAAAEARFELQRTREAFAALPDDQRAALALVVLEGLSYAEVADALNVPIGTVMSRVSRGRATLLSRVRGPANVTQIGKGS
ncbi:MAG: sigma-70 family RNA polymerase sigma factor [Hyphomonadaceae bacterium]|nr:sigma-70 family RNA polymerase sigma factor [Hyphomonadaceae bacterium]